MERIGLILVGAALTLGYLLIYFLNLYWFKQVLAHVRRNVSDEKAADEKAN